MRRFPASLGDMTALQYIDMSWNNITGEQVDGMQWIGA